MTVHDLQSLLQGLLSEREMKINYEARRRASFKKHFRNMNLVLMKQEAFMRHFYLVSQLKAMIADRVKQHPSLELIHLFTTSHDSNNDSALFHVPSGGGLVELLGVPANPPLPRLSGYESFHLAAELVSFASSQLLALQKKYVSADGPNDAMWTYLFSDYAHIQEIEKEVNKSATAAGESAIWEIPKYIRERFNSGGEAQAKLDTEAKESESAGDSK